MEEPRYFKHEDELQQEYVLQTSTMAMTVMVTKAAICLRIACSKIPVAPLFGAINDSAGYQVCTPEEFWKHYHDYSENLYGHQPYERLLLDQLYKSNSQVKHQVIR